MFESVAACLAPLYGVHKTFVAVVDRRATACLSLAFLRRAVCALRRGRIGYEAAVFLMDREKRLRARVRRNATQR